MGLCDECKKAMTLKGYHATPVDHCHHDEENSHYGVRMTSDIPTTIKKEKPREECWCETDSSVRIPGKYVHTPRVCNMLIEYCPVCGRRMEY